jgi:hypothetical protein
MNKEMSTDELVSLALEINRLQHLYWNDYTCFCCKSHEEAAKKLIEINKMIAQLQSNNHTNENNAIKYYLKDNRLKRA